MKPESRLLPKDESDTHYEIVCGVFFGAGFYGTFNNFKWVAENIKKAKSIKDCIIKYGYEYACKKYKGYKQGVGMECGLTPGKPVIIKVITTTKHSIHTDTYTTRSKA